MLSILSHFGRRQFNEKAYRQFALLATLLLAHSAHAHDFWIEPAHFRPDINSEVPLRLLVGQNFNGESLIYLPELFERYIYVGPAGEQPVLGAAGDDPAGRVRVTAPGPIVVGYRSNPSPVSFATLADFEAYLDKEGLERIKPLRLKLGKRDKNIPEIFSRAAKSLLYAGAVQGNALDRRLGFRLELIAGANPYRLKPGAALPLQLIYENQPLEGALVVAFTKDAPLEKLKVRTDRRGHATLTLPRAGIWLVTAVHMVPAPADSGADWESLWASVTFQLPSP